MQIKLKSKIFKNKYIYVDYHNNDRAYSLVIFLSGFSGSMEPSLFKNGSKFFLKNNSMARVIFCDDNSEKQKKDSPKIEQMSFSVYIRELKGIIDFFNKKYSKIVLIGHSFGAVVSILFLDKYKSYLKKTELVLWEQSALPWKRELMEASFTFNPTKKLYYEKNGEAVLNKKFYNELITIDTLKVFKKLNKKTCIVAAKGSADKDAQKYFSVIHNKKGSQLSIIKGTNHCFKGIKAQKELFEKTLNFTNMKD